MACGEAQVPYSLVTDAPLWLDEEAEQALVELGNNVEGNLFAEGFEWGLWDRSDESMVLLGSNTRGYAYARFDSADDGGWKPVSFGTCHWIAIPKTGFGVGSWVIDPAHPPTAESTSIHVVATERNCASGELPVDRAVESIVMPAEQTVSVIVLVEAKTGSQTCQGNPSFELEIDLGEPLGQRDLVDGHTIPPTPQGDTRCTPTESSPPAQPELPPAVAETHDILHWVASDCYWPQVSSMATEAEGFMFGDGLPLLGDPTPRWNTWRNDRDYLGLIAGVLELSYTSWQTAFDGEETVVVYVWPAVAAPANQGNDALWDELLRVYTAEEIQEIREGGEGYAGGFMVGIDENGVWRFALDMLV